jgi:glucose/mannose-6-phosphate isomerase
MTPSREETLRSVLDDPGSFVRQDPSGLLGRIEELPEQCEEGWRRAQELALPGTHAAPRDVVIAGMGGSAIAGDMLRALAASSSGLPVHVVRGYDLPAFVGEETLVVVCSHSGNTEETLSAFEKALGAGARCFAITMGGRLGEIARERSLPLFTYAYDGEPRSALGHQLMALLALGERLGLVPDQGAPAREAIALMQDQRLRLGSSLACEENAAKQLALRLHGRLPVVIGAGLLGEAAHRWKTQLNENSKCWALWEELPELDHNTIEGFALADDVVPLLHAVFLYHEALGARMRVRYDATAEELTTASVSNERIALEGASSLAQLLGAVYLGDLTSYYLGVLNGIDPSPVPGITRLTARLAQG